MPQLSPTWTGKFEDLKEFTFYASFVGKPDNSSRCEFINYDREHEMLSYHSSGATYCVHKSNLVIRIDKPLDISVNTGEDSMEPQTQTKSRLDDDLEELDELEMDELNDEVMPINRIGTESKSLKTSAKDLINKNKGKK